MNAGPSKEQLENLFKTSRKYFDELAKEYYAKDRDFYNKNFAPFYSNPLLRTKSSNKSKMAVIAASVTALLIGLASALIMFFIQDNAEDKPNREIDSYKEEVKQKTTKPANSVKDTMENDKIKIEHLEEELIKKENEVRQKESEARENTGKREVKSKPMERQR